ncbi:MAG: hypothetical protein ACTTH7_03660 [Treponema sp.]
MILLRGCQNLDFAICYMELDDDGYLVVVADTMDLIYKYSEYDNGWIVNEYDEKLLDKDGDEIENLIAFDHSSDNDLFRVPYTDLDIKELANGEIVLTTEAEEKWKKILSGEIPANQTAETPANQQENKLTNYFLTLNENGTPREVALYKNRFRLYIKGDALESLKVLNEKEFGIYIEDSNDFASDFYQIKPSPQTRLAGFPQGFLLEAGFCDIISIRKKGEDENGNYNADIDILDELLQV